MLITYKLLMLVFLLLVLPACNQCSQSSTNSSQTATSVPSNTTGSNDAQAIKSPSEDALIKRGRLSYMSNCIACHSSDPKKDGPLGPSVHGSSRELLYARIVNGNYPESYKPKRETKVMVALPHVGKDIDALYEYLNQ